MLEQVRGSGSRSSIMVSTHNRSVPEEMNVSTSGKVYHFRRPTLSVRNPIRRYRAMVALGNRVLES